MTHTTLADAGLAVDRQRVLIELRRLPVMVAVYKDDLPNAVQFAGGDYIVLPRFFFVEKLPDALIAFEAVLQRGRLTFNQLVLRGGIAAAEADSRSENFVAFLDELRTTASGLVAFKVRQGRGGIKIEHAPRDRAGASGWFDAYREEVKPVPPQRGKVLGIDHFEKVAEVYRAALLAGRSPTQAVAEAFGRPYSTAARWVWQARKAGELRDAPAPGQPGEKGD